mmetsp:Transcript_38917/g.91838  ORF Transcript_38917/g.91838 Transcript_38917/m.91838 type:complete len:238 (-) Transcript_38917:587-1300(-)
MRIRRCRISQRTKTRRRRRTRSGRRARGALWTSAATAATSLAPTLPGTPRYVSAPLPTSPPNFHTGPRNQNPQPTPSRLPHARSRAAASLVSPFHPCVALIPEGCLSRLSRSRSVLRLCSALGRDAGVRCGSDLEAPVGDMYRLGSRHGGFPGSHWHPPPEHRDHTARRSSAEFFGGRVNSDDDVLQAGVADALRVQRAGVSPLQLESYDSHVPEPAPRHPKVLAGTADPQRAPRSR